MNSYGASTVLEITQKSLTLQCWPKINIFVDENFNVWYIGDYKLKSFGVWKLKWKTYFLVIFKQCVEVRLPGKKVLGSY